MCYKYLCVFVTLDCMRCLWWPLVETLKIISEVWIPALMGWLPRNGYTIVMTISHAVTHISGLWNVSPHTAYCGFRLLGSLSHGVNFLGDFNRRRIIENICNVSAPTWLAVGSYSEGELFVWCGNAFTTIIENTRSAGQMLHHLQWVKCTQVQTVYST